MDDDGWVDLVVANDSVPNFLYRNKRDGTFEDASLISGFALTEEGRAQASMGIAVGDYNRDGKVDLYTTSFSDDYNCLYRNEGGGNFTDVTFRADLGKPTIPFLSWEQGSSILTTMACSTSLLPTGTCIRSSINWIGAPPTRNGRNSSGISTERSFRRFRLQQAAVWRT